MKVLVVIGHQQQGSFCHALAEAAVAEVKAAGHEVVFHDLYAEKFDPILSPGEIKDDVALDPVVRQHCDELLAADLFVIVHPNWWGQPPAILKGWIDRVIRQGTIYRFGEDGKVDSKIAGRAALVFTTSNTPRDIELEAFGDPLQNLWENCIFGLCGITNFTRRNFDSVIMSTPEERKQWLVDLRETVKKHL